MSSETIREIFQLAAQGFGLCGNVQPPQAIVPVDNFSSTHSAEGQGRDQNNGVNFGACTSPLSTVGSDNTMNPGTSVGNRFTVPPTPPTPTFIRMNN